MERISGLFSPLNSSQYQTTASKTHHLVTLFASTLVAFMSGQDPTKVMTQEVDSAMSIGHKFFKSAVAYDYYPNEANDLAFAIAVKEAVSLDEDTLFFTRSDGVNAFENYSRIFTIKDAQNVAHDYVLRNGTERPQIELVRLDKFALIETAPAITIFPDINLDRLRQAISRDVNKVNGMQSGEGILPGPGQVISPQITDLNAQPIGSNVSLPQNIVHDITHFYPAEIKSLIAIFEEQNLLITNVRDALTKLVVESSRPKAFVAIKADVGIFLQYRLTQTAGNLSIERVITPSAELSKSFDAIIYEQIGTVLNLSLATIKEVFPSSTPETQ